MQSWSIRMESAVFAAGLRRRARTFTSTMSTVATYVACFALTATHDWWVVLKIMCGRSDLQTISVSHRPRRLWDGQ